MIWQLATSILDVKEQPVIVRLKTRLFAALFEIIKLLPARASLRWAGERGDLGPGGHVFESTSGTMGLALAYACKETGHPLTVVGDSAIDRDLRLRLEALGAHVVVVRRPLQVGGVQAARIGMVHRLMARAPGAFWTRQYDNPDFPCAYYTAVKTIVVAVPSVDFIVATVGTGGSAMGLTRALRAAGHTARLIAVDTHRSVLFGQVDGERKLRGLGSSIIPANLDHTLVDECHWVSAAEAFAATRELFATYLLDIGPTSGAAYLVARWLAANNPQANVVFVGADSGERYRRTVYNPSWLVAQGLALERLPLKPVLVRHPTEAEDTWSYMEWARRSLAEVLQG